MAQYKNEQLKSSLDNSSDLSEIIYMALSDKITFSDILLADRLWWV